MKEILDMLWRAQQRGDLRFLVIGGRGLAAHGIQRYTHDTDVLVAAPQQEALAQALRAGGFKCLGDSGAFSRWQHPDPIMDIVDVMTVEPGTFDKLWADSLPMEIGSVEVRVPSVRSFLALKIFAIKQNPERLGKDIGDIALLFASAKGEVTLDDVRQLCERYCTPELGARILAAISP